MDAFAELFEPLRAKIYAVACRFVGVSEADDVVMETFLKAWQALPKFGGRSTLSTWLCRIARNQALDLIRKRQSRDHREARGEDAEKAFSSVPDVRQVTADETMIKRERIQAVKYAVERISEPHRTAILMRYVDDMSYTEIAAATGVSLGTVMSRLFNAKRKLRQTLAELTNEHSETISI